MKDDPDQGDEPKSFDAGHGMIEVDARVLPVGGSAYREYVARSQAEDRWKSLFPDIDWLQDQLNAEIAAAPGQLFRPFQDSGWFIERMLAFRSLLESAIEMDAAADAVMYAAELSTLSTEYSIKFRCEAACDTGVRQRKTLDEHRDRAISAKQMSAEANRTEWQAEANLIWSVNPEHSRSRVGQLIAEKLSKKGIVANGDTIRRAIKKVGKTG